jgi:hypothetical protein
MVGLKWFKLLFRPKVIAFFTIAPLLLVTAVVKVPCPVCSGSGIVNSTPSMDRVSILEIESEEQQVLREACSIFIVYKYSITLRLLNDGTENAKGWLKMVLVNTAKEEGHNIIDTQYVQIDIPAETVVNNAYVAVFGSGTGEVSRSTKVRAQVITGNVPDITCNGTGRIPLNAWPFVNSLKTHFNEIVRTTQPYTPPLHIDWSLYKSFNQ